VRPIVFTLRVENLPLLPLQSPGLSLIPFLLLAPFIFRLPSTVGDIFLPSPVARLKTCYH
jgi:hypothetical protein